MVWQGLVRRRDVAVEPGSVAFGMVEVAKCSVAFGMVVVWSCSALFCEVTVQCGSVESRRVA